jgi:hypothetical protein
MIIDLTSIIPLVTIVGAAAAPTIAAIWAENRRKRDVKMAADLAVVTAEKVAEVKETLAGTVNEQLSEAVSRLAVATAEIEELKRMVIELKKAGPAKRSLLPF